MSVPIDPPVPQELAPAQAMQKGHASLSARLHSKRDNPLIIEAPERQSLTQKTLGTVLATIFWAIYIYLWLPLLTAAFWALGGYVIAPLVVVFFGRFAWVPSVLVQRAIPEADVYLYLFHYAFWAFALGAILVVWASINWLRFSRRERRGLRAAISLEDLAKDFHVTLPYLSLWQRAQRLVAHFDEEGRVISIDLSPSATEASLPRIQKATNTAKEANAYRAQKR